MALIIVVLLAVAAAWRWTPLGDYLAPERLRGLLRGFDNAYVQAVVAVVAIMLALTAMVPLTLLAVFAGIAFGEWAGFAYTLVAAASSAALVFAVGRALGQGALRRVGGARVNRISEQLSGYGVPAVTVARLLPAAPFTVFNLVAGASHLSFRSFIVGSCLAFVPGIGALTLFSSSVRKAFIDPSAQTVAMVVVVALLTISAIVLMRRRLSSTD